MEKDDLFTITARRCKRCGGLLTSAQGIRRLCQYTHANPAWVLGLSERRGL